jgi:hypothetical protein
MGRASYGTSFSAKLPCVPDEASILKKCRVRMIQVGMRPFTDENGLAKIASGDFTYIWNLLAALDLAQKTSNQPVTRT